MCPYVYSMEVAAAAFRHSRQRRVPEVVLATTQCPQPYTVLPNLVEMWQPAARFTMQFNSARRIFSDSLLTNW